MSTVPNLKNFSINHCALLLGCLLAQQNAFARLDSDPVFFQAKNISVDADSSAAVLSAGSVDAKGSSFAAFLPMNDAARIRTLISSVEEDGGYYSPRLAELTAELGKALQAEGDHRAALEAYDRSFQIIRRQEGLASSAQASILQAKINSQLALGDLDACDALQHSLLSMQQQLLAEKPIALAEAHRISAEWNLKYYLQVWHTPVPGGRTETQEAALTERLGEAFTQYHKALWLLSTAATDGLYDEKVVIERKIAALVLMVNRQYQRNTPNTLTKLGQHSIRQSKLSNNPVLFNHGSAALRRAIEYRVAGAEPVQIAESQLELADWYLLTDQHDEARATYATAVELLRDAGVEEQQIAAILESGQPVDDPETGLLALAGEETSSDFDGYIDVTFDLNRYGKASNARVLADSSHDKQVEEDLLRQIHDGRFRPGFDEGAPVDRSDVTLRYYFARR
ncbi:MAG: hypothetical protein V4628_04240 [Pseudomonadota bacterium]